MERASTRDALEKNRFLINCARKHGRQPANYEPRSVGGLGLLGALLLDFLDLVDEIVGLFEQGGALFGGFHHVGLAAIEEVQVGHSIVVIGLLLEGFLQIGDPFVHK